MAAERHLKAQSGSVDFKAHASGVQETVLEVRYMSEKLLSKNAYVIKQLNNSLFLPLLLILVGYNEFNCSAGERWLSTIALHTIASLREPWQTNPYAFSSLGRRDADRSKLECHLASQTFLISKKQYSTRLNSMRSHKFCLPSSSSSHRITCPSYRTKHITLSSAPSCEDTMQQNTFPKQYDKLQEASLRALTLIPPTQTVWSILDCLYHSFSDFGIFGDGSQD